MRGELQPPFLMYEFALGEHQCRDSHMSIKTSFGKFGKLMAKKAKNQQKNLLSFEH